MTGPPAPPRLPPGPRRRRPWPAAPAALIGLLAAGAPLPAAAEGVFPQPPLVKTLENGLQVVILPLEGTGLVALQTWVRTGSGRETEPGTTGYAHFFEHLMFHGSARIPQDARERALLELGATENAWTSADATCYHALARADRLPALLALEADRFQHLLLTDAGVRREAGAVQGELRKGKASPDRAALSALSALAFRVHPYGHPTIGLDADVEAMPGGLAAARAFFSTWYRPDNLTLVIAGGVDAPAALAEVEAAWGAWRGPSTPLPAPPPEPPQDAPRRAELAWPSPTGARLAIGWRVPAHDPRSPEAAALGLLPELLASPTAPLHRELVDERRLVRSMWMGPPTPRDPGLAVLLLELREGADPAAVEAAVMRAVAALQDDTGADLVAQVQAAAGRARREALLGLDGPAAWAGALGRAALLGGDPLALEARIAALGAVTPSELTAAARRHLTEAGRSTVLLQGPAAGGAP